MHTSWDLTDQYIKRQGLYEISIGAGEESYEDPSVWLNDCDR